MFLTCGCPWRRWLCGCGCGCGVCSSRCGCGSSPSEHVRHGGGEGEPRAVHGEQSLVTPVEDPQLPRLVLLLGLLATQGDLGRHDPLPLGDQRALGAHAVAPAAVAFVALKRRHHPVVPAAGAAGRPLVALGRPQEQPRGGRDADASAAPAGHRRPGRGGARRGAAVSSTSDAHGGVGQIRKGVLLWMGPPSTSNAGSTSDRRQRERENRATVEVAFSFPPGGVKQNTNDRDGQHTTRFTDRKLTLEDSR